VAPWRFHDFRRSFATWAASARVDQSIVRKILDHGQSRRDRLDAIYNRFEYIEEQRDALNQYGSFIGVN
jgi:integrase